MNDIDNKERGEQAIRWLAIVGFVILVLVLAYLAVQAVRYLPTAFSSLASVFESNQRELRERTDEDDDENPVVVVEDTDNTDYEDDNEYEEPVATATSTPSDTYEPVATTTTSSPSTTTPAPVQYRTVVTYKIPVSDPNGTTDLEATFVTVGQMTAGQKFVPTGYLKENDQNAAQFKVKNIGTKTSTDWSFTLKLPDGQVFNSKTQLPLKPGEVSTLTVAFSIDELSGNQQLDFNVTGGSDANLANNAFRTNVSVK